MEIISACCTRPTAVKAHQPRASLLLSRPWKKKKHKLFVPFGALGSPWVIDDGWSDISGHACLGVSQRYAAPLLPGCLALLGPDEEECDRTLHLENIV